MKKLIFLLLFLPCLIISQYTLIPDENFEVALKNLGYDSKIDGKVKTKKIKDVTSLTLNVAWFINDSDEIAGIEDLTGIEGFTSLTHLEIMGDHDMGSKLSVLDLSKNIALKELHFDYHYDGLVENLDLSKNLALETLTCDGSRLKALNISQNTSLKYLNCALNNLETLDLSKLDSLEHLDCTANKLKTLDVSRNLALTFLSFLIIIFLT